MKNNIKKQTHKNSFGSHEYYKNQKDQYHGPYTLFYPNGQKNREGSCNFGREVGIWKYWYSDGILQRINTWKNGRLNGMRIELAE